MLIDWFTVVAQIVNFLILVFLLRRFLYGPILRAMQEREDKIAAQAAEAEAAKQAAEEEAADYRRRQAELEESRDRVLSTVKDDAETQRKEMIAAARQELEEARGGWYRGIQAEQDAFLREIRQHLGSQLVSISRRALADLADAELEARIVDVFVRRLAALDDEERSRLTASARKAQRAVSVRSAFPLDEAARQAIDQTLHDGLPDRAELHFEEEPALLCGVEVGVHDHKVAWSVLDYLDTLESDILARLDGEVDHGRRNGALAAAEPAAILQEAGAQTAEGQNAETQNAEEEVHAG